MTFVPLTKEQFDKAVSAGFTPAQIIENEKKRKAEATPKQPANTFPVAPDRANLRKQYESEAQSSAEEAKRANSVSGFAKNFGSAFVDNIAGGTKRLGETIGSIGNVRAGRADQYADLGKQTGDQQLALIKLIREKEARGEDTTKQKQIYNDLTKQNTSLSKGLEGVIAGSQKTGGQVGGELLETAVTALGAGTYGAGLKTGVLSRGAPSVLPSGGQGLRSLATVKDIAGNAALGYGFDVSQGMQTGEENPLTPGAGTAIGALAPAALRSAQGTANTTKAVSRAFSKEASETLNREIVGDYVDNIFTTTKTNKNRYQQTVARGTDPAEMLTERGLTPDVTDGKVDFTKARESLETEYDELNQALDTSLQRYKDLRVGNDEILAEINRAIASDPVIQRSGRVAQIQNDARALLEGYNKDKGGQYSLLDIQEFKKSQYQQSRKFNNPVAPNPEKADSHSVLARAFKQIVESKADDVAVQNLNQEIGRLNTAMEFLGKVDGTAVKGGRLGVYFGRAIGTAAGANRGPVGSLIGLFGGDFTAKILQQNAVIGPLKRFYLRRQASGFTNPVLEQSIKYLDDIEAGRVPAVPEAVREQILRDLQNRPLLLEAPAPGTPQSSNNVPIRALGESTIEPPAQQINRDWFPPDPSFKSGAIPPTTRPTPPKEVDRIIDDLFSALPKQRVDIPPEGVFITPTARFSSGSFAHFVRSRNAQNLSRKDMKYLLERAPEVIENPTLNIKNPNAQSPYPDADLLGKFYSDSNKAVMVLLDVGGEIRDIITVHFKKKSDFDALVNQIKK